MPPRVQRRFPSCFPRRPKRDRRPSEPAQLALVLLLEGGDAVGVAEGEADLVDAGDEAMLAKGIDLEPDLGPVGGADDLPPELDGDMGAGLLLDLAAELRHLLRRQDDRQEAILEAVTEED